MNTLTHLKFIRDISETVAWSCSVKMFFLKNFVNKQESTCETSFLSNSARLISNSLPAAISCAIV